MFGARAEVNHEVQQVVRLVFSRAESATPASFVSFIEDHRSVPTLEEVSALFRIVEDQSRRDDGDAEGAARDVLGTPGFDDVPVVVLPDLLIGNPHRAGDTEPVFEFHLPLKGERGGLSLIHI